MIIIKSTGEFRRVDDLSRVVIPKKIRKELGIEHDDYLEVFTDDDCVIFKKVKNQEKAWEG